VTNDDELNRLKSEIITSMAQVEDAHHRVVLSLLIRTMNSQESFANNIFEKLEVIIKDEERIRDIVLNGHVDNHKRHHDWVETRMQYSSKIDDMIRWSEAKIEREREFNKDNRHYVRVIVEKILYAGFLLIAGAFASEIWEVTQGHMGLITK